MLRLDWRGKCGVGAAGQSGIEKRIVVKVACLPGRLRERKSHRGGEKSIMSDKCDEWRNKAAIVN